MCRRTGKKADALKAQLIIALADPTNFRKKRTDIYHGLGIEKTYFYDLMKEPDVIAGVTELVERHTDACLSVAWGALMDLMICDDKDVALDAIKLFFEMKGKYDPKGIQQGATCGGGVVILPQAWDNEK